MACGVGRRVLVCRTVLVLSLLLLLVCLTKLYDSGEHHSVMTQGNSATVEHHSVMTQGSARVEHHGRIPRENATLDTIVKSGIKKNPLCDWSNFGEYRTAFDNFLISVVQQGRLGNTMFSYAALLVISCFTRRRPVMSQEFHQLKEIFEVSLNVSPSWVFDDFVKYGPERSRQLNTMKYVDLTVGNDTVTVPDRHVILDSYFNSVSFFMPIKHIIREEFRFRKAIRDRAETFLQLFDPGLVRIGIHVRGTDMASDDRIRKGYGPPPAAYYPKAMDYFRNLYPNVIFIVCTDDRRLARKTISGSDVVFSQESKPEADLAILANCKHVIIGRGSTFGWWAGWLSNGFSVHYRETRPGIPVTGLYSDEPQDEYNSWIGIEV